MGAGSKERGGKKDLSFKILIDPAIHFKVLLCKFAPKHKIDCADKA